METLPEDASQGSQPRMKEEAGRVKRRLRNLKGLLTKEVTAGIDKLGFLRQNIQTTLQKSQLYRSTMPKTYLKPAIGVRFGL